MSDMVTTPVSVEAVTLAYMKRAMNIADANVDHDTIIAEMTSEARDATEHELGRSIGEQTITLYLDEFPVSVYGTSAPILIPRPPTVSITSVGYVDPDGVQQVLDPLMYRVDHGQDPQWLCPAYGESWPDTRTGEVNAVTIVYVAGYTEPTCPAAIKRYIAMQAAAMFENREAIVVGSTPAPLGFVRRMVDRYRIHTS